MARYNNVVLRDMHTFENKKPRFFNTSNFDDITSTFVTAVLNE